MKKILIAVLSLMPLLCTAQVRYADCKDNQHYLAGAVQMLNGRAAVKQSVEAPLLSAAQIQTVVDTWAKLKGVPTSSAVMKPLQSLSGVSQFTLRDNLIFKRNFINLDKALMEALLVITVEDGRCEVVLTDITYYYGTDMTPTTGMPHEQWHGSFSSSENTTEVYAAEEQVTDDIALTRKGRLVRSLAKYRVSTIDYVDAVAAQLKDDLVTLSTGVK